MNINWNTPTVYLVDGRQVFISNNYTNIDYNVIKVDEYKRKDKIKNNQYKNKLRSSKDKKKVSFDLDKTTIEETYSRFEYDRSPIDSVIYLRALQRININEWNEIFTELNNFKTNEMDVHKESLNNIKIHNINS